LEVCPMPVSAQARLQAEGRRLSLHTSDGERQFAALWLRERAPDSETLDAQTGQRLIEAAQLPLDLGIERAALDGDRLALSFSDGHRTAFDVNALLEAGEAAHTALPAEMTLWDASLTALP